MMFRCLHYCRAQHFRWITKPSWDWLRSDLAKNTRCWRNLCETNLSYIVCTLRRNSWKTAFYGTDDFTPSTTLFSNFFKHSGKRRSIHKTPICSQCECEPDLSFAPLCQLAQSSGNCSAKLHKDKRCPYWLQSPKPHVSSTDFVFS